MHVLFFVSSSLRGGVSKNAFSKVGAAIICIILFVRGIRYWALLSLGRYWNTKILVVPDADLSERGRTGG
ncbi:alkylpyrone methyltransferase, BpsB [Bacillus velezensis]|nr:isoprenylcysteine carboxylmethyltransferase family protein [Bacillus velezensis]QJC92822.1 alkylpyrone methyltransferase, BpsB [Bacillus velezensis]